MYQEKCEIHKMYQEKPLEMMLLTSCFILKLNILSFLTLVIPVETVYPQSSLFEIFNENKLSPLLALISFSPDCSSALVPVFASCEKPQPPMVPVNRAAERKSY